MEDMFVVAGEDALGNAVDGQLDAVAVGINLHVGRRIGALGEAPVGDIDKRLVGPVGFVEVECVFFDLAVGGDEAFVVSAGGVALRRRWALAKSNMFQMKEPQTNGRARMTAVVLVDHGLPFLRMPRAPGRPAA